MISHTVPCSTEFICVIYRTREIIVFSLSLLLLLYTSHEENIPKRGVHFAWKDILFELLG